MKFWDAIKARLSRKPEKRGSKPAPNPHAYQRQFLKNMGDTNRRERGGRRYGSR